jgi:REP element-mobilizing transposase RayT
LHYCLVTTPDFEPFRQRRTIRLAGRDYSADGAYFVTVCTIDREPLLGSIVEGVLRLNAFGSVVADTWRWLPVQYPYVTLDEWCVMPDHLHGILVLGGSRGIPAGDTDATTVDVAAVRRKPVGGLIGAFKTVSTKHLNALRRTPGVVVWQRDFWDHVVRDDEDLRRIRAYIRENPRA